MNSEKDKLIPHDCRCEVCGKDLDEVTAPLKARIEALEKRVQTVESFVSLSREIPPPKMPSTDDVGAL